MMSATNKMQQIPFIDFLNQLYMFRATNSSILRSTFLTVYALTHNAPILLPTGSNIGELYQSCIYGQKALLRLFVA